MTYQPVAD